MATPHPRRRHISRDDHGSSGSPEASRAQVTSNMTLPKGATFHSPTTPPAESADPVLCIPSLPRRSQTSLGEIGSGAANIERMNAIMSAFDQLMSNSESSATPNAQALDTEDLPLPRGMLNATVTGSASRAGASDGSRTAKTSRAELENTLRQTRATRKHHASDSGIGSTETGTIRDGSDIFTNGNPTWTALSSVTSGSIQQTPLAISQTLSLASTSKQQQVISAYAARQVGKHILQPLLQNGTLEDFHPIVRDIPSRIKRREISCLRDVEKALVLLAPARSKSAGSYLLFCETSIQCIHTTVSYVSERDQRRPTDPPYTNGYFVDLVEQVREYSRMMAASRRRQAAGESADEMDYSPTESLVLEGGLSQTGRPAQLVRKKDGKSIPIGTGSKQKTAIYEGSRPSSSKRASPEVYEEDSVQRSMARRRRLAPGEVPTEPAPRVCLECRKEFKRPCDLTKHEKTHSRPWKCPEQMCKYHTYGWPTEKERDRHVNDKHSDDPAMFTCKFCSYRSKRESNCKQHMEKAHGWKYVRAKTAKSGKATSAEAHQITTPVSIPGDASTPASINSFSSGGQPGGTLPHDSTAMSPNMNELFTGDSTYQVLNEPQFSFNEYSPSTHPYPAQPIATGLSPSVVPVATTPLDFAPRNWMDDANPYNAQLMTPDRSIERRPAGSFSYPPDVYRSGMTPLSPAQQMRNLSPGGQGNVMLYSPESFMNPALDEGYEEFPPTSGGQFGDWSLFPSSEAGLAPGNDALFEERPFFGSQAINFDADMSGNGL